MEKGKDRGGAKPLQATVVIRLIAGGHLVYLAHDLFKIYLNPAEGGKITSWEALRSSLQWGQDWLSGLA